MLAIKDLEDALGLSEYQVRRRIDALNSVLEGHIKRGKQSKILVDSGGLDLLRELEDLRSQGLTIEEAVEQIKTETGVDSSADAKDLSTKRREGEGREELLREQISKLEGQVEYLKNQVEKKDKKIEKKEEKIDEKDQEIHNLLSGKVAQSPLSKFWEWLGL